MPGDQGSQIVSIIFHASAQSSIVNRRHKDTRMLGIYTGGYITPVPPSNVSLSPLVCEISDGTHQVRVETTKAVSLPVAKATEWVVLRWTYTGVAADDYMAILAVDSPLTNDIVVGKCSFTVTGDLLGFDYSERSDPDIQHLFLRVEPTGGTELRVRIRGGRIQTNSGVVDIADQTSDLFTPPTLSKVYLVYVTAAGVIAIDSSGTASATPVAPSYKGKLVLAEVTLASTDTSITADKIEDTRSWIIQPTVPDGTTLELDSNGKLKVKDGSIGLTQLGIISPRWSVSVCNANNYTTPAQFVSPIATFSYPSHGSFSAAGNYWGAYWLYNNSIRFRMKVNSIGSNAKVLKLFAVDNGVYVYIDGVLAYSKIAAWYTESSPESVNLNFTNGEHTVDIVFNDQGGNAYLNILGDIVDETNVKFVQP